VPEPAGPLTRVLRRGKRAVERRLDPFRRGVEDPSVPLSLDMSASSSTLLIAFGGIYGGLGVPPFELFRATSAIPVKRLFVRDLEQAWYHRGLPGSGGTIEELAQTLRELVDGNGVKRLVLAGNSAGGYAALLFGTLLGADVALSFAPQTVIDLDVLASMDDHRWDQRLGELADAGALDERWLDLARTLPALRRANTRYEVYFDDGFATDRLHAEHIGQLAGVRLHARSGGAHSVAQELRSTGELGRILGEALVVAGTDEARAGSSA
jgi:pimeloyl-ACP methyl ester carboxylesterase